jgi:hypothetical protein
MTDQEINIKIAEYMGVSPRLDYQVRGGENDGIYLWNKCEYEIDGWLERQKKDYPDRFKREGLHKHVHKIYPDYCHSLDAVWEVEEKLKAEGKQIDYVLIISAPYEALFQAAHATARQRCEAIIKVLEGMDDEV